ncbi:MAG: hypothetical protein J6W09_07015 [Bacteroidales bacterium]|nr:hypothetical protein [Bacteroidales bacterium]
MKASTKGFILDCISITLGVLITFAIQDWIDKAHDRKEVQSALWLVRTELSTNLEDINTLHEFLRQERSSAQYLLNHRQNLDAIPIDSLDFHSGIILADVNASVSHDALELLKSSSLFQKMGNSILSMKIIRAYDSCQLTVESVNRHIADRDARFENSIDEDNVRKFASEGFLNISDFMKTDYGLYSLRWLTNQVIADQTADVTDIKEALTAIDNYLRRQ